MIISFEMIDTYNKIIDVRNSVFYLERHLPGSINVPRLKLLSNPEKYISKNEVVYLVCDGGKVSLACAKILNSRGYKCYSIEGGLEKILG